MFIASLVPAGAPAAPEPAVPDSDLHCFTKLINNKVYYAQSPIDKFSNPKKLPQIAVAADMLDTSIDVPERLTLVFFKGVMSKAKSGK